MVTTDPDDLKSEKNHVNKALEVCNYPRWAIDKVAKRLNKNKDNKKQQPSTNKEPKGNIVIQYLKGKSEQMKRFFHLFRHCVFQAPAYSPTVTSSS